MFAQDANLLGAVSLAVADLIHAKTEALVDGGFPPAALVHLSHCGRPTIESLRRVLGLSHSATVRLVDRMSAARLVARGNADWDGRAVALRLTSEGAEAARRILERRGQALDATLARAFSEEEKRLFGALSARLLAALTSRPDDLHRICRLCDFDACPSCPVAEAAA